MKVSIVKNPGEFMSELSRYFAHEKTLKIIGALLAQAETETTG
jgi:hypothetical protein